MRGSKGTIKTLCLVPFLTGSLLKLGLDPLLIVVCENAEDNIKPKPIININLSLSII